MKKFLNLTLLCAALAFGGEFNLKPADGAVTNLTPLRKSGEITLNLKNDNPNNPKLAQIIINHIKKLNEKTHLT